MNNKIFAMSMVMLATLGMMSAFAIAGPNGALSSDDTQPYMGDQEEENPNPGCDQICLTIPQSPTNVNPFGPNQGNRRPCNNSDC